MHLILIVLFLFLSICLIIKGCSSSDNDSKKDPSDLMASPPAVDQSPIDPVGPHVVSSASIGITGNIFVEDALINSAKQEDGGYDFSSSFATIANSYQAYDCMIAHFESTLGGTASGDYSGNEIFNSPDEIVTAMKDAGIDVVLTSNNHCYDTGHNGLIRTQEVLKQNGIKSNGTQLNAEESNYLIQNINDIKIGIICYTHESGDTADGNKTIRDIPVAAEDTELINSFNYRQMDEFYEEIKAAKAEMDSAGVDFTLFFIHWGNEFDLVPSATQKKIAQNLCEAGFDFIIGSHPHTVQPVELLTSEAGKNTFCLYSTGNALSAQRRKNANLAPNGHSEDGIIFGIKFERWSDGSVKISDLNATPLWTDEVVTDEKAAYTVLPVDVSYNFYPALSQFTNSINGVIDPKKEISDFTVYVPSDITQLNASYSRTMDTVLKGLNECRQILGLMPVSNIPGS